MLAAVIITVLSVQLSGVCLAQDRGGVEGAGCKCQPLNSRMLRLNLNAALQEAFT